MQNREQPASNAMGKHLRGGQPQRAQRQHSQKTLDLILSTALVTQGSSPLHVTAAMAAQSCDRGKSQNPHVFNPKGSCTSLQGISQGCTRPERQSQIHVSSTTPQRWDKPKSFSSRRFKGGGGKRRKLISPRVETHLQARSALGRPQPGFAHFALPPATPCDTGSVARTPAPGFSDFGLKMCQRAAGGSEKGGRI